mgnify:CR=1 FL=1
MDNPLYIQTLHKYLPTKAIDSIVQLQNELSFQLIISKPRVSKYGDFRPATKSKPHRISINGNLKTDFFLATLLHEIAHLKVWKKYGKNVLPHGMEWKNHYNQLLISFANMNAFGSDVKNYILYLENKNRIFSKQRLNHILIKSDKKEYSWFLEDLKSDQLFMLKSGKKFIKKEKIRTRYKCLEYSSGKTYSVHPLAEVFPL